MGFRAKRYFREAPAYGAGGRGREVKATLQIQSGPKFIILLEMEKDKSPQFINASSASEAMQKVCPAAT